MTTIQAFIQRRPVLTYYTLTFAISWGLILFVLGPGRFFGGTAETILLTGSLSLAGPCMAGILLTGVIDGRAGLRGIVSRLIKWRVGTRWYAVALLTGPLLSTTTLLALSLTSPVFLPAIITTSDKMGLLLTGIGVGLVVSFFEELGWTGFAMPRLKLRYSVLTTGLMMGLLWSAWHFPLFVGSASSSGTIPPALYVAVLLFSWLPPYRVLMVWVYDHTGSLLAIMLMHLPIVVSQYVLTPPTLAGAPMLTSLLVFGAALWLVVAAVAVARRRPAIATPAPQALGVKR